MGIAERVRLDLTRRGQVLELVSTQAAAGDSPARYTYLVQCDGGRHQASSTAVMKRGDVCVMRRYQVTPLPGSGARMLAPWIALDPEGAEPVLPPENYGG